MAAQRILEGEEEEIEEEVEEVEEEVRTSDELEEAAVLGPPWTHTGVQSAL